MLVLRQKIMIQITFTSSEIDTLHQGFTNHPHPKVRQKMHVLYLKSIGIPHQQIRQICRISKSTLTSYLKQYIQGGIAGLIQLHYKGQPSQLDEHADKVKKDFKDHPPSTLSEARQRIFELIGLERSIPQIQEFVQRLGLRRLKTGSLPGGHKGNTEQKRKEQKQFLETKLQPRLEEARQGKRVVLFTDAAHFVHGAFMSFLWCFTRVFVGTPPGRKRFNVLGAINAVSMSLTTVTNDAYINAKSVCQLLRKLYWQYLGTPITLVLDNARYQKCKLVRRYARVLGIELLFLPSYSPQLNLIERLWKFVKKKVLNGKYYPTFEEFKKALQRLLNALPNLNKELESLLAWNFQSFEKVQILA